jgi:ribonuclease P protein component
VKHTDFSAENLQREVVVCCETDGERVVRASLDLRMSDRIFTLRQFDEVFAKGQFVRCGNVAIVRWIPRNAPGIRWGVAVSAKRWKRAVERNRIKRVLRESIHPLLPLLRDSLDVVVLFCGDSPSIPPDSIREEIRAGLIRAQILKV